jgi:putative DNA primase/helicase
MQKNEAKIGAFPNSPAGKSDRPPATIANVKHVMEHVGITIRYNLVKKRDEIIIPNWNGCPDNVDNATVNYIISLVAEHHMPTNNVSGFLETIANQNAYNPVADWIRSEKWDGQNRLPELYASVIEHPDTSVEFKELLLHKWLLSITAANILASGFRARGILTFQGPQSIGKTTWFRQLISDEELSRSVIKLGFHLDPSDKDSVLGAITNAVVELGELDSSFARGMARLKGFTTEDFDRVRRPYGKRESEYPRRTIFGASVNDANFLLDPTGNSRFWVIPVIGFVYPHRIDMQQLFAQLLAELEGKLAIGADHIWWLNPDEELELALRNGQHRAVSAMDEKLGDRLDLSLIGSDANPRMTATDVAEWLGYKPATSAQVREAGASLRQMLGEPSRSKGRVRWAVPMSPVDSATWVRYGKSIYEGPGDDT